MAYELAIDQIHSITDPEFVFSTTRFLPEWDDIPDDFKSGNLYTQLATALCFNRPMPACTIELKAGVEKEKLNRCIRAHVQSYGPKHEHKIAGVGYMIACACTLHPRAEGDDRGN